MKKRFWLVPVVILITVAAAVLIIAILRSSGKTPTQPTQPRATSILIPDAARLYLQASDEFSNQRNITVNVTSTVSTITAHATFTEETQQLIHYQDLGTSAMRASACGSVRIGDYSFDTAHYYQGGNAYLILNETIFRSPMTAADFKNSYIPAVMIDPSLYSTVTGLDTGEFTSIIFQQPKAPENWAADSDAVLISANASAVLNTDKHLSESSYEITYRLGDLTIRKTFRMQLLPTEQIDGFPTLAGSTRVECLDALTALERACGYLLQAQTVHAESSEIIFCEAFGDDRKQTATVNMTGADADFTADVRTAVELYNSSRGGEVTRITQDLLYSDGKATLREDGTDAISRPDITQDIMKTHCQNMLISTVLLPDYICAATASETDTAFTYHFDANAQMSELMCENICIILYQTPELLDAMASGHTDLVMSGLLTVDKRTGLPLSSGIRYESSHTIEDFPYALRYETEQTYTFSGT